MRDDSATIPRGVPLTGVGHMSKKICLIEDDELVRERLALQLSELGYVVLQADDGEEGLKLIERESPEAAIIDILMPGKDGLETITAIRRLRPDIRIVAVSAGGRVGPRIYLDLAKQVGADATFVKPLDIEAIRGAVEGHAAP
jgi:DNA-binding response OmpR family regulator